jgi:hypothetical protein
MELEYREMRRELYYRENILKSILKLGDYFMIF